MTRRTKRPVVAALAAAVLLVACGGGGGEPAADPAIQRIDITVIDGPIRDAVVCLDENQNDRCDAGEPSGRTDAEGRMALQVDRADAGKYPVVAMVGTDAVDRDHGPVATAFVMKAPADRPGVVSPLTSLVQAAIVATGATSGAAEAGIRASLGVELSLFEDFTRSTSDDAARSQALARMLVVVAQRQAAVLAASIGTEAIDGAPITAVDIERAGQIKLLESQREIAAATVDPRLLAADTPAQRKRVESLLAREFVANAKTGISASQLGVLVGVARQPDTARVQGVPAATLLGLDYVDPENWYQRVVASSAVQNTADADGNMRRMDRRARSVNGFIATWSKGAEARRQSDTHWNGSAWVHCGINQEYPSALPDAQGQVSYNYCDGYETGRQAQLTLDIGGKRMHDVYLQVQAAGFTNLGIAQAQERLGSEVFPAGSRLSYRLTMPLTKAIAYNPGLGSVLRGVNADLAAAQQGACQKFRPSIAAGEYRTTTTTIARMISTMRGSPCVYAQDTIHVSSGSFQSGPRNEWWGQSTVNLGGTGLAFESGSAYYSPNTLWQVGFGAGNTVSYYACRQSAIDFAARNCDLIGSGAYKVETLGDAKVLTLQNQPAALTALAYERVFVERDGKVFVGFRDRISAMRVAGLDLVALNALNARLGIPTVDPERPMELTETSYQGHWRFGRPGRVDLEHGGGFSIPADGADATCHDTDAGESRSCRPIRQRSTGAFSFADGRGVYSGILDFAAGTATATYVPDDPSRPSVEMEGLRF